MRKKKKRQRKSLLKSLGKQLVKHTLKYAIIAGIIMSLFGAFKFGLFDTVLRFDGPPSKGTTRRAAIDFRRNIATCKTIDKDTGKVYKVHEVVGVRLASIEQFEDGSVKVVARNKGFGIEPGYTVFISNSRPRVGFDIQWAYWKRLGLSSGLGIGGRKTKEVTNGKGEARKDDLQWNGYPIAFNYNLPFRWTPNTNIFMGYLMQRQATAGISVKW